MVLKRIGPVSLAKLSAVLYAAVGLLAGACFSLLSLAGAALGSGSQWGPFGVLFAAGAILWMPLMYGVMGFLGSLLMAWLYNVLARALGGVRLDLE